MHRISSALVLTISLAAVAPAWAGTVYQVSKVTITGNKSVATGDLMAVVHERPGDKVTVSDILADRDALMKLLEQAHVAGGIKVSVQTTGAGSEIMFAINDQGVQTPQTVTVAPKLDAEIFQGNVVLSSDALAAASGLKPGDDLSDAKILAAEKAIVAAYKAAKPPVSLQISGETKQAAGGAEADVIWHIVETKAKPARKAAAAEDNAQESDN